MPTYKEKKRKHIYNFSIQYKVKNGFEQHNLIIYTRNIKQEQRYCKIAAKDDDI